MKLANYIVGSVLIFTAIPCISQREEALKIAAEKGDAAAMYDLGVYYEGELGSENHQDYPKTIYWLRRSADLGTPSAMRELGVMYGRGNGVQQNFTEEMAWYKKAANSGDDIAMYYIGHMYRLGNGVSVDLQEAAIWYRKAAEKGQSSAMYMLGKMYDEGLGVSQNFQEAYFWISLSDVAPPIGTKGETDRIAHKLTKEKLIEVQERTKSWVSTHPKIHWTP